MKFPGELASIRGKSGEVVRLAFAGRHHCHLRAVHCPCVKWGEPTMNVEMGNSASAARIKARMTLDEGRDSSRPIEKRRHQKERSERALKDDFIRRACGLF